MPTLGGEKRSLILRVQNMDRAEELIAFCDRQGWKTIVGFEPDQSEDISDLTRKRKTNRPPQSRQKISRNAPCPCGSGKKYKKCCLHSP